MNILKIAPLALGFLIVTSSFQGFAMDAQMVASPSFWSSVKESFNAVPTPVKIGGGLLIGLGIAWKLGLFGNRTSDAQVAVSKARTNSIPAAQSSAPIAKQPQPARTKRAPGIFLRVDLAQAQQAVSQSIQALQQAPAAAAAALANATSLSPDVLRRELKAQVGLVKHRLQWCLDSVKQLTDREIRQKSIARLKQNHQQTLVENIDVAQFPYLIDRINKFFAQLEVLCNQEEISKQTIATLQKMIQDLDAVYKILSYQDLAYNYK